MRMPKSWGSSRMKDSNGSGMATSMGMANFMTSSRMKDNSGRLGNL